MLEFSFIDPVELMLKEIVSTCHSCARVCCQTSLGIVQIATARQNNMRTSQ